MTGETTIRVLLVEDQQMFAQGLERALRDVAGIEVVGTASGVEEAVKRAATLSPDVILMDYNLPDGDGAQAAQQIKADHPQTKVVMLTAYDDDAVLVAAIEAGCSGFVTKSNALEDAVAAVRAAHAGEALIAPEMLARLLPKLHPVKRATRLELTDREREILGLLAQGLSTRAIAQKLFLSINTVRNHVQNVLTKLNAHSKLEAVSIAVREGIIRFP